MKLKGHLKYIFFFILCSCAQYYEESEVPFYTHLQKNYQSYADYKAENNDWFGAIRFYKKVREIKKGHVVWPEHIASTSNIYNYFAKDVTYEQFYDYRDRMYLMLNNNRGKAEYPNELADMQFFYDCWTLEEGGYTKFSQPVRCRINFITTLEYLEFKLLRYSPEELASFEPEPPPPLRPKKYIFYFDFDSSMLTDEGTIVMNELLDDLRSLGTEYKVVIYGHADRMGTRGYNVGLSKRRSDTVKHYLIRNGIPVRRISTEYHGEIDPQVITENQFKEELNRRVTVVLKREDTGEEIKVFQQGFDGQNNVKRDR